MTATDNYAPVSLIKRLISIIYDQLLLIAIFFSVGIPVSILTTFLFNSGNAITEDHPLYLLNQVIILCALFISSVIFYCWFWIHGGQTLGMKTWRIMLVTDEGHQMNLKQSLIRYFSALLSWLVFGIGFLWSLSDRKKRCWHDIMSKSHLVQIEKK